MLNNNQEQFEGIQDIDNPSDKFQDNWQKLFKLLPEINEPEFLTEEERNQSR